MRLNPRRKIILSILAVVFGLSISAARAEDELQHKLDSFLRYAPSSSAKTISGDVGIVSYGSEYSYKFKVCDKLPVKFSLGAQYIGIENTTEVELPAHLTGAFFDLETTLPFFGFAKTYQRLGISPSFYGDDWDFDSSNFRIPFRYILIRKPSDQWTLIAGVAVYPDYETAVLPILGFIYKPNKRLTFNIIPKRPNITYLVNDNLTWFLEGGSALNSEFEVTKDNLQNVVLGFKEMRLGSGVAYKFNKFMQSSLSAGALFNRSLKYRDSLGKVGIKEAFYAEFRLIIEM